MAEVKGWALSERAAVAGPRPRLTARVAAKDLDSLVVMTTRFWKSRPSGGTGLVRAGNAVSATGGQEWQQEPCRPGLCGRG